MEKYTPKIHLDDICEEYEKQNKELVDKIKEFNKIFRDLYDNNRDDEIFYPTNIMWLTDKYFKEELK